MYDRVAVGMRMTEPMGIPTYGNLWDFVEILWESVKTLPGFSVKSYLFNIHCIHNPVVYYILLHICIFSPT